MKPNAARDALPLDDTGAKFANEPCHEAAFGNEASSREESHTGPHTTVALEQGDSFMDTDRTFFIQQNIRLAKISQSNVQVGTKTTGSR